MADSSFDALDALSSAGTGGLDELMQPSAVCTQPPGSSGSSMPLCAVLGGYTGACKSCSISSSDSDRSGALAMKQQMATHPAKGLCIDCEYFRRGDADATVLTPVKFCKFVNSPIGAPMKARRDKTLPLIAEKRLSNRRLSKTDLAELPAPTITSNQEAAVLMELEDEVVEFSTWIRENPGKQPEDEGFHIEMVTDGFAQPTKCCVKACKLGHMKRKSYVKRGVSFNEVLDVS